MTSKHTKSKMIYTIFSVVKLKRLQFQYLWMCVIRFGCQDAIISTGGDRHQTLDIFYKLLIILSVPEHHTVLQPIRPCVCIHHRVTAVTPLQRQSRILAQRNFTKLSYNHYLQLNYFVIWPNVGKVNVGIYSQANSESSTFP